MLTYQVFLEYLAMIEPKQALLIIDDDTQVLASMRRVLRHDAYELVTVSSGVDAISALKNQAFAAILCDQNMPEMQGIEVLKKAQELRPQATRLLITASQEMEVLTEAINIGQIYQFIPKPWDPETLRQIVHAAVRRYQLQQENDTLHRRVLDQHKALRIAHETLQQDLKVGARIHEVLLIADAPKGMDECHIERLTRPSKEIDGDFYAFYRPREYVLDVVLGDVMGKGIPAALVGTAVKSQMQRLALPLSIEERATDAGLWRPQLLSPAAILEGVQKELAKKLIDLEYFVTLFYGRFDFRCMRFTYVDCGSTKPILFRPSDLSLSYLSGDNFPLGMKDSDHFVEQSVSFKEGDLFLFYSDGVTESRNPQNLLYGDERLVSILKNYPHCEPRALVHLIEQSALKFTQSDHLEDDLTLLALQVKKDWSPPPLQRRSAKFRADLSQLLAVRQFVDNICSQTPDNVEDVSMSLQLAINEAFCNIVDHSLPDGVEGEVLLEGHLTAEGVAFSLFDNGNSFKPSEVVEPSLSGDRSGGFGVYLIRQLADEVSYIPKPSPQAWNELRLYKAFQSQGADMQLSHNRSGTVLVITLNGDHLDAKQAPGFKENVHELICSEKLKSVVFDLKELQFIDSSGLGSFLSVLRHLNGQGGDLKLAAASKPIQTMLEMVRMHKLFEIFNTADDAVQSFEG